MMTQFPGARQPALGIQDAAMLPAQAAGNLIQRLAAAEAAYAPTTQTFDSTTSSTTLNATAASGGGSLRSLMMPLNTDNFVPITPSPSPAFYNGQMYSQFGNQALVDAIIASQTGAGSMCGRAVLNACGVHYSTNCGCGCVPELGEEVEIDEDNTNGIDDNPTPPLPRPQPPVYSPPVSAQLANAKMMCHSTQVSVPAETTQTAQPTANIQYVTYNA